MFKFKFQILLLCFCIAEATNAQVDAFEANKSFVSAGYGIEAFSGRGFFKPYEVEDNFEVSGFGPVHLKLEYGMGDEFGMGLVLAMSQTKVRWTDQLSVLDNNSNTIDTIDTYYQYEFKKITATLRFNWHPIEHEHWDPYVGMGIGYKTGSWQFSTNDKNATEISIPVVPMSFSASLGCRYLITSNVGLFVETGIGHGYLQGGLHFKF